MVRIKYTWYAVGNDTLDCVPVLMLSTGFEPLFQTDWRRAISAVVSGRAEIIESHDSLSIGTPSGPYAFPLRVRYLTGFIAAKNRKLNNIAPLSKKNIYVRDEGKCQYCGTVVTMKSCTIDHVMPKSKGGVHDWCNVVLACRTCNHRKGDKLVFEFKLKLHVLPWLPTISDIVIRQSGFDTGK